MAVPGAAPACADCGATREPEHLFCGVCGARLPPAAAAPEPARAGERERRAADEMNRLAGTPYEPRGELGESRAGTPVAAPAEGALPYCISPNRIVLLTFLTAGLYIFYWMYATWRQYRDHTGETAYPLFHALTLLVPIYQFFRLHAHIRVYQELMDGGGVPCTLNPLRAALIYLAVATLGMVAFRLVAETPVTSSELVACFALNVAQVGLVAGMLRQIQGNLNRFWRRRLRSQLGWRRLSLAEVGLVVLGLLVWLQWLIILLDPTLLTPPQPGDAGPGP